MRTYTAHKLTDAQLRRLSAIVNDDKRCARYGTAGEALVRKELVADQELVVDGRHIIERLPTCAGRAALIQARKEGW